MNKETLIEKGFVSRPHFALQEIFFLDVGRKREISIGSIGTPNEMVFISQRDHNTTNTDLVCVHNFDYDGYLTEQKLDAIISIFTKI